MDEAEVNAQTTTLRTDARVARAMASVASGARSPDAELERGVAPSGVRYIVGGWSGAARRELALEAAQYSVTLVFAHRGSSEYIADVNVRVADERGAEIAALNEAGPIVLLGLPPGSYQVTVTRNGHALARAVTVGPRTRRQTVFYWSGVQREQIAR
jgi:hypothetical protein